eukprot:403335736
MLRQPNDSYISVTPNSEIFLVRFSCRYTIIPSDLSFEVGTVIQTYLPTTVSLILSNSNTISVCRRFIKLTNTFETLNSCTYNHDQSMIQFTISSRIEFDVAYEYEIAYILNPGISTLVTGFRIVVNDQNGNNLYDTTVTSSAVYIQPGDLLNQSVSDSSLKVSDTGIFTFKFQISNKIPGNGLFQVIFPTEIEVPSGISGSDTRIKVYDQDWQTGTIIISSRSITFTNALKGNILTPITGSYVQIEIQKVINPKSLKETSSFTIATMDSTYNKIDQVGSSMTIKPTIPGDIQIFSVGPQSNPQVGQTTDISFNIQVAQAYENGGYLLVTFPSEVVIKNLTCFPFIGFVTQDSNCIISSTSPQTVKIQNAVSSTRLYFLISSAQNPSSTKTTSTFTIQAYDSSNFLMSQILSGVNYTSTPASLKSGTSIRSITQVNSATGNNQTISLSITNPLQNGDIILVRIPYEQMQVVSSNFSCEITALGITTRPSDTDCSLFKWMCSKSKLLTCLKWSQESKLDLINYKIYRNLYNDFRLTIYKRQKNIRNIYNSFAYRGNTEISLTFTPTNTIPNNGYFRIYFSQSSFYDPTSGQILCQDLLTSQSLTCISVQNTDQTQGINYIQINETGHQSNHQPTVSLLNRLQVKDILLILAYPLKQQDWIYCLLNSIVFRQLNLYQVLQPELYQHIALGQILKMVLLRAQDSLQLPFQSKYKQPQARVQLQQAQHPLLVLLIQRLNRQKLLIQILKTLLAKISLYHCQMLSLIQEAQNQVRISLSKLTYMIHLQQPTIQQSRTQTQSLLQQIPQISQLLIQLLGQLLRQTNKQNQYFNLIAVTQSHKILRLSLKYQRTKQFSNLHLNLSYSITQLELLLQNKVSRMINHQIVIPRQQLTNGVLVPQHNVLQTPNLHQKSQMFLIQLLLSFLL